MRPIRYRKLRMLSSCRLDTLSSEGLGTHTHRKVRLPPTGAYSRQKMIEHIGQIADESGNITENIRNMSENAGTYGKSTRK